MKKLSLGVFLLIAITGCSSSNEISDETAQDISETNANITFSNDIAHRLSATYCEQKGFERFYETEKAYLFTCKGGGYFNISK